MSDKILISKVGLFETIKCTICKNPNQTEHGCDGSCQYDKELHAKIVEAVIGIAEQRPHVEWIFKNGKYRCSVCLEPCATFFMNEPRDNFCLWCGADMRKEGDE